MAKVQHYKGLHTNLDNLYDALKKEIESQPNLQVVSEYKGTLNNLPLRSFLAVNKSLKVIAGSLNEIHVSITGGPEDYAVEVSSNGWFSSLLFPGAVGLIVGGPIGLAGGLAVGGTMAYEFERHIWKKILEIVKKESKNEPTVESVDHYH